MQRQSRISNENAPFSSAFGGGFDESEAFETHRRQATVRYPRHLANAQPARARRKNALAYRTGTGERPRPLAISEPEAARASVRLPIPKACHTDIALALECCLASANYRCDRNGVEPFRTGALQG